MAQHNDEEEGGIGNIVVFFGYTVLAIWGVYTTFIVMGAMLQTMFPDREDLRFALALVLAFIIPVLTAMGGNSRKEDAEGIERLSRVALGTTIFSFGCAVIVAITMAAKVEPALRHEPNWFLDNPGSSKGMPDLNRRYSRIVAQMTCKAADAAGMYYCAPYVNER
jgi:hypothetical protein